MELYCNTPPHTESRHEFLLLQFTNYHSRIEIYDNSVLMQTKLQIFFYSIFIEKQVETKIDPRMPQRKNEGKYSYC